MKIVTKNREKYIQKQKGFSLPELLIVILIIVILLVIALPQINASRRLFRFSGMQRQIAATLTEARQQAMSQRRAITFRYDNAGKNTILYGGNFGALNDPRNRVEQLYGSGVTENDIVYGRPGSVSTAALRDSSNLTNLVGSGLDITFQPDGSVIDAGGNPANTAIFFYYNLQPEKTAFAVSVLGAGGRVKIWRYSQNVNEYVE
jgi:prepilin-type N-terminal cleavage/methylation domain-containing protein